LQIASGFPVAIYSVIAWFWW